MQLEQRFDLALPPDAVWPAFHDLGLLVDCLPGASLSGPVADGHAPLRMEVRLGPITAAFEGQGTLTLDEAARRGRFEGAAADRRTQSRVKGVADFALAGGPDGGSTVVVTVDYALTGALAQFSRGALVREIAATLSAQFAARLQARLAPSPEDATPPGEAATPLSAGGLLVQALKKRWAGAPDKP
jgi:carbon monoxide dehydrogenase subunit G